MKHSVKPNALFIKGNIIVGIVRNVHAVISVQYTMYRKTGNIGIVKLQILTKLL